MAIVVMLTLSPLTEQVRSILWDWQFGIQVTVKLFPEIKSKTPIFEEKEKVHLLPH